MDIGEKIKQLRKNNRMSQEELASKLQINRNYLSRIETEKSEPTASIVKSISNIFNVNVESLLGIESVEAPHEDKIKYVTENCKMLIESDLDFVVRIISIMKEEYVKRNKN